MTKKEETKLQPPQRGHNYDAGQRAEYIESYYQERRKIELAREAFNAKIKKKVDANTSKLKGLMINVTHAEEGYKRWVVRQEIANAENPKDREAAQARLDLAAANMAECIAVAEGAQQLDFNSIIERGVDARQRVMEAETKGKITVTGKADGETPPPEETPAAEAVA